jgi:wobble nucleotide-excising tRNase
MLDEIIFIQNLGRFETARNNHATLGPCTLIFGENGWGKSTLADILRSLTTNNPAILIGRKTLTAAAESKAVLRFGTGLAQFANGAWTGPRPRIAIYDSAFINDNVCSGDIVSADHLKNQYGLVIGDEGVRLIRHLLELDAANRENNNAITSSQAELAGTVRAFGIPGMTVDTFLTIAPRRDIEDAITALDADLQRVRRGKELKAAAEPVPLPIPTASDTLRDLLSKTIDGIAEAAAAKVRMHIQAHAGKPDKAGLVHESWLESGEAFVKTKDCPFCGQPLNDRALIDAYKNLFSETYKTLAASIKKTRETFARYNAGEFKTTVSTAAEQNATNFHYWREAGRLDPPQIRDVNPVIAEIENAAAGLDTLFATKQANLTETITGALVQAALAKWEAARSKLTSINAQITQFQSKIKALKASIDIAQLPRLEAELKLLQATKRRHEPEVVAVVNTLNACKTTKDSIATEKAQVRTAIDDHGRTITATIGNAINGYLARLAAGFRIDYREPDYRGGKEPTAAYNILINQVAVAPRADDIGKPSFRNTLSAGDKSTLALALFLAKINADPDLNDTIAVLDDPFTSLDNSRRQFTAIEIKKLCSRTQQTIVMSHDKNFLRLLWEKIDQSNLSPIALQTGAPGMTTIVPYDIEAATQPRHVTERMQIEEYLDGEPHELNYIRTRLRTVCEDFYRKGDPALFREAASLGEIIRGLEEAPADHPYKGALDDLRDINEYSRGDSHAAVAGNPLEETTVDELKEFCRRAIALTRGM